MQRRDTGNRARGLVAALAAVGSLVAFATLGGVGLAKTAIGLAQYQYEPGTKVTICHKGKVTITISTSALPAHLAHDDIVGECPPVQSTPEDADAEDAEDEAEPEDAEEAEATTKAPKPKTKKAKQAKVKPTKADDAAAGEDTKVKPAKAKQGKAKRGKAKQGKAKGKPTQTTTQMQPLGTDPGGKSRGNPGGKGHGNAGGNDKSRGNAGGNGKGHGNGKK